MKANGIYKHLEGKTAKMFTKEEWNNFDVIVAMDDNNYKLVYSFYIFAKNLLVVLFIFTGKKLTWINK